MEELPHNNWGGFISFWIRRFQEGEYRALAGSLIASIPALALSFYQAAIQGYGYDMLFFGIFCLFAIVTLMFLLFHNHIYEQLQEKGHPLPKTYPIEKYTRFEDLEEKGVRFGYVNFYPTLVIDDSGEPSGLGLALLRDHVFESKNIKFVPSNEGRCNWSNAIDKLVKQDPEFDILATPLYEIKERKNLVSYTTPLFYTDIGAFVSTNGKFTDHDELRFGELTKLLTSTKSLRTKYYPGELQDKLTQKYMPSCERTKLDEYLIPECLMEVAKSKDFDILFCEKWQAEVSKAYKDGLIKNILLPQQLLFPVGFVLRKTDDTLRKYVNLRLMELEGNSKFFRDLFRMHLPTNAHAKEPEYFFYRGLNSDTLTKPARVTNVIKGDFDKS